MADLDLNHPWEVRPTLRLRNTADRAVLDAMQASLRQHPGVAEVCVGLVLSPVLFERQDRDHAAWYERQLS